MQLDELHEGVRRSLSKDRNLEGTQKALVRDPSELTPETAAQQRQAAVLHMGRLEEALHYRRSPSVSRFEIWLSAFLIASGLVRRSAFLRGDQTAVDDGRSDD